MIETFKDLEKVVTAPPSQQDPAKILRLLRYCHFYIQSAQDGGSTPFDEVVQRLNGFVPITEIQEENKVKHDD